MFPKGLMLLGKQKNFIGKTKFADLDMSSQQQNTDILQYLLTRKNGNNQF
jgi:hypothetical protein